MAVSYGNFNSVAGALTDAGRQKVNDLCIVRNGLLLHLDAGDSRSYPGSGTTWFNLISSNYHAVITAGGYTTDRGGAITFGSGSGAIPGAGTTALNFSGGGFTISVWLRHTGVVSTARIQRYFSMPSSPSEGPALRHGTGSAAQLEAFIFDASNTLRTSSIANMVFTNTYYNFVYTYNGTTFVVYRNGTAVLTTNLTITLPTPGTGGYGLSYVGEYFEGNMHAVNYYNRGLTATEISQNFNALRSRFGI